MPGTPEDASAGGSPDYLAPYADAVRAHGATFEATLWASKEKQVGRFAVIAEMADLTGRVIVDMVRAGAARGLPEARFETVDFASDTECFERLARSDGVDLVVFSGSLNTFEPEHAFGVAKEAFRHAREGVVFNFLSSRNHERHAINPAPAKRFDPASMLDRALTLTPRVRFRQDYFDGHDATIAMMHSERVRTRG